MSLQDNLSVRDKQPTQYPLTPKVKMEDAPTNAQHSKASVSRYMGTLSTASMFSLTKFVPTSTCRPLVGKTVRRSSDGT